MSAHLAMNGVGFVILGDVETNAYARQQLRRPALPKTPFRDRPPREQAEIVGFIALSLTVVTLAQNDLRRRPASQIRGSKTIWRLVSLNALGALIYLCWGRVRGSG